MRTLLLVEDEKLIKKGIRAMIDRAGIEIDEIIECDNGEDALEILKHREIEAMFTDVRLPQMDGLTLVKEINILPKKPLIAAISSFEEFEDAVSMMKYGVKEYIFKPVFKEKVIEVLENFELELSESHQEFLRQQKVAMQQIKYMLFYDNVTKEEIENICLSVHPFVPVNDFFVVCLSISEDDAIGLSSPGKYYYIQGEENLNMILVDAEYRDELLSKLSNYSIGVSGTYKNFRDFKQAFCEAAEMRRTAFETCKMIVDADKYQDVDIDSEYGVKVMMQTANLICSNKFEEALAQLEIFVKGVKERKYKMNEFQEQMKTIITTTIKVYSNQLKNKEHEVLELLDVLSYQTIDDYMEMVRQWIKNFDELVSAEVDEHKTNMKMQKAIEFIKENYATDLNMAVVSNYISMNYSLFSFTFKQYTGTNFVNYLKDIRVGEAKKLLTETDMKINEISQAVGYDHEKHFMKIFKSLTGLTPTQYRNNLS